MGKGFGEGGKSGGKGKAGEPKKPVTRSAHVAQRPVLLPQVEMCVCVCGGDARAHAGGVSERKNRKRHRETCGAI
jgi:hypothetical protein